MKHFLIKTGAFIGFVLLLFVFIELFILLVPNAFNNKATYLQENAENIELLILGSSHAESIIPEDLTLPSANLAYRGQDVQIDSAFFHRYINELPNLTYVILEFDYHTLEHSVKEDYFRIPWYYRFHDIELFEVGLLNKLSIYYSDPIFFNYYIKHILVGSESQPPVSETGAIINDNYGDFQNLNFDKDKIYETAVSRMAGKHEHGSWELYRRNSSRLNSIIRYCNEHDIKIFLVATPVYDSYLKHQVPARKTRAMRYADSLLAADAIDGYWNYEKDPRFTLHNFKDDDHLNESGMIEFTQIVDSLLSEDIKTHDWRRVTGFPDSNQP